MAANPVGYVSIFDGGVPRTITGIARAATSGGQFMFISGASDAVGSGANSFVTSDLLVAPAASGAQFVGVALHNAGSNSPVSIATRGTIIATANGTVTASYPQMCDGADAIQDLGSVAGNVASLRRIGRALSTATSGNYALFDING